MKIYLDHNVIIYLRKNTYQALNEKIEALKKAGNEFIFSPAHLEEIAVSFMSHNTKIEIVNEDIEFLTQLCENNSLRPATRDKVLYKTEYPRDCYNRVISSYSLNNLAEDIEKRVILDANENPAGNPLEMNHTPPSDVFNHIIYREMLLFSLRGQGYLNQSETMEYFQNWPHERIKSRFCLLEHSVNICANWLEKMGFYREKTDKYRSRLHDVSHIIYGSYSDILVTNDSKLLKKAQAIYSFLGISTTVYIMDSFLQASLAE